jgi:hypothetical protein
LFLSPFLRVPAGGVARNTLSPDTNLWVPLERRNVPWTNVRHIGAQGWFLHEKEQKQDDEYDEQKHLHLIPTLILFLDPSYEFEHGFARVQFKIVTCWDSREKTQKR